MTRTVLLLTSFFFASAGEAVAQYPWPVTPLDASHYITGTFSEYRDTGSTPHFHNGVDIPKPDRSPVYAVSDGVVTGIGSDWIRVGNFGYVHVAPSPGLVIGDSAFTSETVVGTILDGYGHIHLTDGQPSSERQPLREDGITPFVDDWTPSIENVRFYHQPTRQRLASTELAGQVEITFRVREPNAPPTSAESRLNNGAYIVGYKILSRDRQEEVFVPADDGVRFRFDTKPSDSYVHNVFDRLQSSTASHVYIVTNDLSQPSAWDVSMLEEGEYTVLLFAEDTKGNRGERYVDVEIQHRDLLPPPQPTLLSVTSSGENVRFTWTGGETDDLAGYRIYSSDAPGGPWSHWMPDITIGPADRTLEVAAPEAPAYFYLTAIDTLEQPNESDKTDTYGFSRDTRDRRLLIVDGFDRSSGSGSWSFPQHNFAASYGSALAANGAGFETVANEQIIAGEVALEDYDGVIWLLGDESTSDGTFSSVEQAHVRDYMDAGGRLFVSGSEIAWDLDERGNSADKAFIRDYLKVTYAGDDAGSYTVNGVSEQAFDGATFQYGSSPYVEDYPDYFTPHGGSVATLEYANGRIAAVQYEGVFGGGEVDGKLIVFGFPFETIQGTQAREAVMGRVVDYLFPGSTAAEGGAPATAQVELEPPYPNPATSLATANVALPTATDIVVSVYDALGRRIAVIAEGLHAAGRHEITWVPDVAPGVYFLRLEAAGSVRTQRLTIVR